MWTSLIHNPRTSTGAALIAIATLLLTMKVIDASGFAIVAGIAGTWAFAASKDGDR